MGEAAKPSGGSGDSRRTLGKLALAFGVVGLGLSVLPGAAPLDGGLNGMAVASGAVLLAGIVLVLTGGGKPSA